MAPHGQVGAIDLEHEARPVNGVILLLHDVDEAREIGVTAGVVLVAQEVGDDARRGGRHEGVSRLHPVQGRAQIGGVFLHRRAVLPVDGAVA